MESTLAPRFDSLAELFAEKRRWTQGAMARGDSGEPRTALDWRAESWCLVGAVEHVYRGHDTQGRMFRRLCRALGPEVWPERPAQYLSDWSDADERTWEEVLELATRAEV